MHMGWGRSAGMILLSTAVMFVLMYQLVYSADHVFFSLNRLVASLVMACVMTLIMLGFMWSMYRGQGVKIAVLALALVIGIGLLLTNRSQALVSDVTFMQAMIPAALSDPRVRELADKIIESQVREIAEMELLIDDIRQNGERGEASLPARPATLTPEMAEEARRVLN
jgi:FlaA1/EpsC-like NDP-sugar epimerase